MNVHGVRLAAVLMLCCTVLSSVATAGPGPGATPDWQLESFFQLQPGRLDQLTNSWPTRNAIEGSGARITFWNPGGMQLRLQVRFLTNERMWDNNWYTYNDFSFRTYRDATYAPGQYSSSAYLMDTRNTTITGPAFGFAHYSPMMTLRYVLPTTGWVTIGLGAVDVCDPWFNSGLVINGMLRASTGGMDKFYGFGGWWNACPYENLNTDPNAGGIKAVWEESMGGNPGDAQTYEIPSYTLAQWDSDEDTFDIEGLAFKSWSGMDDGTEHVVPEPGSLIALGSGLIGLSGMIIRRRR